MSRGEAGTLWIKGESAAILYWQAHEKSKEILRGDWVVTGDHMRRDDRGYFWYEGRTDDMLKVGGIFVSPYRGRELPSAAPGCSGMRRHRV